MNCVIDRVIWWIYLSKIFIEEKQIKKRLDKKIERLEIISESEKSDLVDSYQDVIFKFFNEKLVFFK